MSSLNQPQATGPASARNNGRDPFYPDWRTAHDCRRVRPVHGKWVYLYRAVDRAGKTVDFRLGARRDVAAAETFFAKTIRNQGRAPKTITLDGCMAPPRAVQEVKTDGLLSEDTTLRSSTYLNNLIEQDHCNIKYRVNVMLGLKRIRNIEVIHGPTSRALSTCGTSSVLMDERLSLRKHSTEFG